MRIRITCYITKVTDTHSQYTEFPRQQCLRKRASILRLYVYCLSFSIIARFVAVLYYFLQHPGIFHDKLVPITTAWRVLRLRMEERPPVWRVAVNILNKHCVQPTRSGTPALGLGELLITPHCKKSFPLRNVYKSLGSGLILWYDITNGKRK